MVQDQLVEYVSSQLKLDISRDAVKAALTGVGWAPLDVEDTLKKVESASTASAQPKAMESATGPATSPKFVSFSSPGNIVGQAKNPEPQTIRVSDLVSAAVVSAPKIVAGSMEAGKPVVKSAPFKAVTPMTSATSGQAKTGAGRWVIIAIAAILILGLGGFSVYLFLKNNNLTSQLQAQSGQGQTAAASQNLAAQVQALNASSTALMNQVATLTAENQELMTNLSLVALPVGSSSSTAGETPVSVSGMLSAGLGKNTYIITTSYGVKVSIKNSSVAAVAGTLQPLLGTMVQASGTYTPGTPIMSVMSVNGASVIPAPVATSTAATSLPATSTVTATPPAAATP